MAVLLDAFLLVLKASINQKRCMAWQHKNLLMIDLKNSHVTAGVADHYASAPQTRQYGPFAAL